jgi:hypothetical protein
MDLWEILGLLGLIALWAAIGCVPWFIALVATRARGATWRSLPLAVVAAISAGLLIPAIGFKGWAGFGLSLIAAEVASAAVVVITTGLASRRAPPVNG